MRALGDAAAIRRRGGGGYPAHPEPGARRMNRDAMIRTAVEHALRQGWQVERYTVSSVETRGAEVWIRFEGESRQLGDFFTVTVDRATGKPVRLLPGK